MTRRLLLSPDALPLWRDDTTLQFGVRAAHTVRDPAPYLVRLAEALERGASRETLDNIARAYDAGPAHVDGLLAELDGVVSDRAVRACSIALLGFGDVSSPELDRMADALDGSDDVVIVDPAGSPDVAVLVARHAVYPRDAARWLRRDVPHLPVALGPRRADIGPLVLPGETACVACITQYECDRDAAWPLLVAQLTGRRASETPRALLTEAAVGIAALLAQRRAALEAYLAAAPPSAPSDVVDQTSELLTVDVARNRTWRPLPPHQACGCRFP